MFIFDAYAEAQAAAEAASPLLSLLPLVIIFVIFFFLVIRPQHKRIKLHNQMLAALEKGDKVVSSSGIIGVINKVDSSASIIYLEIAKGIEIKMTKNSVAEKMDSGNNTNKDSKSKKSQPNKVEQDVTPEGEEKND